MTQPRNTGNISKEQLFNLYKKEGKSAKAISRRLNCSENKINYWLKKFSIEKRNVSEAIYLRKNPKGDPFKVKKVPVNNDSFLFGLGLGLYWGEGNKRNRGSIRIGNSDPYLLLNFISFLEKI